MNISCTNCGAEIFDVYVRNRVTECRSACPRCGNPAGVEGVVFNLQRVLSKAVELAQGIPDRSMLISEKDITKTYIKQVQDELERI